MVHCLDILTSHSGYSLQPPIQPIELPGHGTNNQTIAFESPSGRYVWRRYQTHASAETIGYEHKLLRWLADQPLTFSVPAPIAMNNGESLYQPSNSQSADHQSADHQSADGFFALFPLIPGADPDRSDPVQMEAVGTALGELHCTLKSYPQTERPGLSTYGQILLVHPHLPAPSSMQPADVGMDNPTPEVDALFAWFRDEVARLEKWKSTHYAALPRQVIHGDFTPANTLVKDELFLGNRVSAILDFDFALPDVRAVDVAAGLYFTMRLWDNPEPWPVAEAFCRGYSRWVPLTDDEITAIPWLMRLRSLVSTVWWFGKEAAAGEPVKLWRIEDLQNLVAWLDVNQERLLKLI